MWYENLPLPAMTVSLKTLNGDEEIEVVILRFDTTEPSLLGNALECLFFLRVLCPNFSNVAAFPSNRVEDLVLLSEAGALGVSSETGGSGRDSVRLRTVGRIGISTASMTTLLRFFDDLELDP